MSCDYHWEYELLRIPERYKVSVPSDEDPWKRFERIVAFVNEHECCPFGNTETWYEWEQDMRRVSALLPGMLIKVHASSYEDPTEPHTFDAYFLDGKMQLCEGVITYPPFDESLLK